MIPHTWLLSGIPRSGSSLCCRLAGELPDTVALSEPMSLDRFAGAGGPVDACLRIENFTRETRERISVERRAPSVQVAGRLDDDRVGSRGAPVGLRQPRGGQGEILIDKPLSDGFALLIKHNALFAALLPALGASFPCLALVRNPLAVLVSWQTVNLPVNQGRIPAGEQFDANLRLRLDGEPDALHRQIRVLDWFFDRFRTHIEPENVLRYEDVVESGGRALFRRLGRSNACPESLQNRNANSLYRGAGVDALLEALLKAGGAWSEYYSGSDCERVADVIRSTG